ncbi:MAG: hypothetical protein J5J06_14400 [Phycisphaerae bacterium]|nr:hypothetical protein [Phycisphaerae bacterium]
MAEYSNYQKKLINRYYDRRDEIMLTRLGEIVSELFIAESDAKAGQLWKRAEKAMANLRIPASVSGHILAQRDPALLARHLRTWLDEAARQRSGR